MTLQRYADAVSQLVLVHMFTCQVIHAYDPAMVCVCTAFNEDRAHIACEGTDHALSVWLSSIDAHHRLISRVVPVQ